MEFIIDVIFSKTNKIRHLRSWTKKKKSFVKFVMSVCEDNCLAWLQGPPGDFGPKGTQGPKGPQGAMVGST